MNTRVNGCRSVLIHHKWYTSFATVARTLAHCLRSRFPSVTLCDDRETPPAAQPDLVIYIHDTIDMLLYPDRFPARGQRGTIAWTDTCLAPELYPGLSPFTGAVHLVTSQRNLDATRHLGVCGILPRPVLVTGTNGNLRRASSRSGFVVIGYCDESDRKNFAQLRELVDRTGIELRAVTNATGPWERIEYASLSEGNKFELLSRARFLIQLSRAEGFGMPPAEAMSVGTPVIYSDVAAHNEFAYGRPVRPGRMYQYERREDDGKPFRALFTDVDMDDAVAAVHEAACLPDAVYETASELARAAATRFQAQNVSDALIAAAAPHLTG